MTPSRTLLLCLAAFLALSTAGLSATPPPAGPTKGDAARGKKVYKSRKCEACHKADGSGGFKVTGNPTPDWRDSTRMADPKYDDDYLRDCITNGRPESGMVAWAKQGVKPSEIEDLIAYIRTFSVKQKPAAKKAKK
jgi:mono/diheme cytochrome c family protein